MAGQLDEQTVSGYESYVAATWGRWTRLEHITTASVADHVRTRLRLVKRTSVRKELSAIRGFLRWCVEQGHLTEDTAPIVRSPPASATGTPSRLACARRKAIELSPEEVARTLALLPEYSQRGHHVIRAYWVLCWETGLRRGTLEALRSPEDFRRGDRELRIRDETDKARFGRSLPLTETALAELEGVARDQGLIFGVSGRWARATALRAAAAAAGLPPEKASRIAAHDLRHGRATQLATKSANLPGVAYLLGHRQVTTTALYVRPHRAAAEEVLAMTSGQASSKP